ncbi:hypothetical protein [Gloeobacter violaceus]|uniref:Gsr1415 protein n=1 Tax=Gloeobacter violaceus (strain ATCC 29082 / PCC 7421) TaxID=251221 RepID=Q7NKR2_GLOVI|nr:hypothetical protein [Gloeobacter violaceus]BAC89356.1 gsr1415 [Gloeobacter violaceus PCC 7421]
MTTKPYLAILPSQAVAIAGKSPMICTWDLEEYALLPELELGPSSHGYEKTTVLQLEDFVYPIAFPSLAISVAELFTRRSRL